MSIIKERMDKGQCPICAEALPVECKGVKDKNVKDDSILVCCKHKREE